MQKRHDQIILLDWLSPISAVVKLRLHSHTNVFVDHLSFIWDQKAGWQIVAKIWHLEANAKLNLLTIRQKKNPIRGWGSGPWGGANETLI